MYVNNNFQIGLFKKYKKTETPPQDSKVPEMDDFVEIKAKVDNKSSASSKSKGTYNNSNSSYSNYRGNNYNNSYYNNSRGNNNWNKNKNYFAKDESYLEPNSNIKIEESDEKDFFI